MGQVVTLIRPNMGSGRTFWRAHLEGWEKPSFRCAWVEGAASPHAYAVD